MFRLELREMFSVVVTSEIRDERLRQVKEAGTTGLIYFVIRWLVD